jgi:hypothetical protein
MPSKLTEYNWDCMFPDSNEKIKFINKSLRYRWVFWSNRETFKNNLWWTNIFLMHLYWSAIF